MIHSILSNSLLIDTCKQKVIQVIQSDSLFMNH